ncbi:hypothetical protein VNO77_02483 [Canavalia gladiata]|uniref:Uncharacterized protein n=1 Tax=Canavalia gladiata TaxID=3824 RepID=A0AAN9MYD0_CANGL
MDELREGRGPPGGSNPGSGGREANNSTTCARLLADYSWPYYVFKGNERLPVIYEEKVDARIQTRGFGIEALHSSPLSAALCRPDAPLSTTRLDIQSSGIPEKMKLMILGILAISD